jgi:hypothetical protein
LPVGPLGGESKGPARDCMGPGRTHGPLSVPGWLPSSDRVSVVPASSKRMRKRGGTKPSSTVSMDRTQSSPSRRYPYRFRRPNPVRASMLSRSAPAYTFRREVHAATTLNPPMWHHQVQLSNRKFALEHAPSSGRRQRTKCCRTVAGKFGRGYQGTPGPTTGGSRTPPTERAVTILARAGP